MKKIKTIARKNLIDKGLHNYAGKQVVNKNEPAKRNKPVYSGLAGRRTHLD